MTTFWNPRTWQSPCGSLILTGAIFPPLSSPFLSMWWSLKSMICCPLLTNVSLSTQLFLALRWMLKQILEKEMQPTHPKVLLVCVFLQLPRCTYSFFFFFSFSHVGTLSLFSADVFLGHFLGQVAFLSFSACKESQFIALSFTVAKFYDLTFERSSNSSLLFCTHHPETDHKIPF